MKSNMEYKKMSREQMIELLCLDESIIKELEKKCERLYKANKEQMSKIVEYRRQIQILADGDSKKEE